VSNNIALLTRTKEEYAQIHEAQKWMGYTEYDTNPDYHAFLVPHYGACINCGSMCRDLYNRDVKIVRDAGYTGELPSFQAATGR
jgi:hypothetical protein